jgi:hypothetical protein
MPVGVAHVLPRGVWIDPRLQPPVVPSHTVEAPFEVASAPSIIS